MAPASTSQPLLPPASNPYKAPTPNPNPANGAGSGASTSSATPAGTRLFSNFGVDFTWITPGAAKHNMGLFRMDLMGDIAFPLCAAQPDRPLLLEPHFAINYWNGPVTSGWTDHYDMAAQTFDASLGLRWQPVWQPQIAATALEFDLFFSVGIYSDFKRITGDSFRFPSWAYVSLDFTKNIKGKIGVWYLDRVRTKILPSGGVIWSPNNQWEFQFLFPNPRITYHPVGGGLKNMNIYARGEYGGGSWTVKHADMHDCRTDYNDYRIMFGLDWEGRYKAKGYFELGVAFARELYLRDGGRYSLDAGFVLDAGLHF